MTKEAVQTFKVGSKPGATGLRRALRDLLADGEWHPMTDIYTQLHHLVPTHTALRAAERDTKIRAGRARASRPDAPHTIQIARGIAMVLAQNLRSIKAEHRNGNGMQREWRMPLPEPTEVQQE